MTYSGYVDGMDVIAKKDGPARCLAFINKEQGGPDYIQVETADHRLQTALELASAKQVAVEVTYDEVGGAKTLSRVRLLDR